MQSVPPVPSTTLGSLHLQCTVSHYRRRCTYSALSVIIGDVALTVHCQSLSETLHLQCTVSHQRRCTYSALSVIGDAALTVHCQSLSETLHLQCTVSQYRRHCTYSALPVIIGDAALTVHCQS